MKLDRQTYSCVHVQMTYQDVHGILPSRGAGSGVRNIHTSALIRRAISKAHLNWSDLVLKLSLSFAEVSADNFLTTVKLLKIVVPFLPLLEKVQSEVSCTKYTCVVKYIGSRIFSSKKT